MKGISPALANAFRRILLSEVPTIAIEKVRKRRRADLLSCHLGIVGFNIVFPFFSFFFALAL